MSDLGTSSKNFSEAFRADLFEPGQKVLLAVSGGADSMVLLELMARLAREKNLELAVLHYNYGLRGAESDKDQWLVAQRCRDLDIFLVIEKTDALALTDKNLEERARELRRAALIKTARGLGSDLIALGHNLDDQAETILMRLLRGSGLTGLKGMSLRDGVWARPLLGLKRAEIRNYAKARGIAYRWDRTNRQLRFTRNKIRRVLLPLLARDFNPKIKESLIGSANLIQEDERFLAEISAATYHHLVKEDETRVSIAAVDLLKLPPALQRRVLREMIKKCAPALSKIGHGSALLLALGSLRKSDKGMKLDLGSGLTLRRKSGILSLTLLFANKR